MSQLNIQQIVNTILLTLLALIAFAANSVLGRMALKDAAIDAATYTAIRLATGALVLFVLMMLTYRGKPLNRGNWLAGVLLFLYAITFSFAYISLDTGTGALILFGAVQVTMIMSSLVSGYKLHRLEWFGVTLALTGFVYLVLPGVSAPSLSGFILMTIAGIAWGGYTLKGRGSKSPLIDTAFNFMRTIPLVAVVFVVSQVFLGAQHYTSRGIVLAMLSGGVASGMGYAIWYKALRGLTSTQAAVVQLSVPVIAAFGGVIFVAEPITFRLAIAAILILGGIALVVAGHYYLTNHEKKKLQ